MRLICTLIILSISTIGITQIPNNYSLEFNGLDGLVEMSNPVTHQQNFLSVSAYVNMNTLTHTNDPQANIVEQAVNGQWSLGYDLPTKQYLFGVKVNGAWQKVYAPADSLIWQNIVGTFDKANSTIRIYLDGSLADEATSVPAGDLDTIASYPFAIGGRNGVDKTIDGKIDDVHVWRLLLDSTQIQHFIDCPPDGTELGLMVFYNFETGSGSTAFDQVSNNDGSLLSNPNWVGDTPYYNCGLGVNEKDLGSRELLKVVDLMGREITPQKNKILIYVYSDGTTERIFEFE